MTVIWRWTHVDDNIIILITDGIHDFTHSGHLGEAADIGHIDGGRNQVEPLFYCHDGIMNISALEKDVIHSRKIFPLFSPCEIGQICHLSIHIDREDAFLLFISREDMAGIKDQARLA